MPGIRRADDGSRSILSETIRHLAIELWRSPLLLAYVTLGLLSAAFGPPGTCLHTLANYVLLGVYLLVIRLWTNGDPAPSRMRQPSQRPGRDLLVVAILFALAIAWASQFFSDGLPTASLSSIREALSSRGWNRTLAGKIANATVNLGQFLPALFVTFLAGLRPRNVGLVPNRMGLGLALVALGVLLAGVGKLCGAESSPLWNGSGAVPLALAVFAAQILVNGLPEEFIFRGVILSRLIPRLKNPRNALVVSSVLFVLMHVPSLLVKNPEISPWLLVFGPLVTPGPQPTGLVWGYLFYRTGSIWPGVLWHDSSGTLGFLFW